MNLFTFAQRLLWLLLQGLTLLVWPAQAQMLANEPRPYAPPQAQVLEDPTGQLDIHAIRQMDLHFRLWTGGGTELNFGYTPSAWWIRLPLQREATAPKDWLLEVHYARLNTLEFHAPGLPPVRTGSDLPLSSRPVPDSFFVFPLQVDTDVDYAYLRVTSSYALTVPITLWQPQAFFQSRLRYDRVQFAYFGALSVLALFALVVFVALRDRRFGAYAGYAVTAGLGIFAGNGFGRLLLWPDAAGFDEVAQSLFFNLSAVMATLFARWLLLSAADRSWLSRCLQISQLLFGLTAALCMLHLAGLPVLRMANLVLMGNAMAMAILITWASLRALQQRKPGVRFFLAGWMILAIGVVVSASRALGWIPSTPLTSYAVQISTGIEMLFTRVRHQIPTFLIFATPTSTKSSTYT